MSDLFLLSPLLVIFTMPIAIMAIIALFPRFRFALHFTFLGVLAAFVLVICSLIQRTEPRYFYPFFVADNFSEVTQGVLLLATLFVIFFSKDWFASIKQDSHAFFILLLISLVGALTLVMSAHFMSFFVSLELLSIPVYAMIAYEVRQRRGLEAALKYILLAGFSVAVLLFGIALLYSNFESLSFDVIVEKIKTGIVLAPVLLVGFFLFFVGLAFKIGLFPFHMWLPDVYEGAPLPVTAYLATVSKGAVLFFAIRFFAQIRIENLPEIASIVAALAVLSMFIGNIMALKQQNLKRLLAYSSIAQVGYMMIGIIVSDSQSTLFYVITYFAAVLCALCALAVHSHFEAEKENIRSLDGLYFYKPSLAIALTIALLSFTGLPLTLGFLGKLYILSAAVDSLQWTMALSLAISSAIGFYAYFKVILAMATRGSLSIIPKTHRFSFSEACVLLLALLIVGFGVYPNYIEYVTAIASFENIAQ